MRNGADALTMHQAVIKQKKTRHASHRRAAPHYKITGVVNGPVNGNVPLIRVTERVT